MSVAELKSALADIPGIENLTMSGFDGSQWFGLNGLVIRTDPAANHGEIEQAIRDAVRRRQQVMSDDTPAPQLPATSRATGVTRLNVTGAGFVGSSFRDKMQALRDELNALPNDLDVALTRVRDAAQLGRTIVSSIHAEADDLHAILGQFTNSDGKQ